MSLGRNQRINNHLLLSAIAAALCKEGNRHCQKHPRMEYQGRTVANIFPLKLYNLRKCILSASERVYKVHILVIVYFKFVMTVSIYLCNHPLQTEIHSRKIESDQVCLLT